MTSPMTSYIERRAWNKKKIFCERIVWPLWVTDTMIIFFLKINSKCLKWKWRGGSNRNSKMTSQMTAYVEHWAWYEKYNFFQNNSLIILNNVNCNQLFVKTIFKNLKRKLRAKISEKRVNNVIHEFF